MAIERVEQVARGLEHRLAAQLKRIRRRFLLHGSAWVVAAAALATVAYYAADRALLLPRAVRLAVSAGVLAWLVAGVARRLVYPLRRRIARDDVAVTLERRFPELQGRLISAVQLHDQLARARAEGATALRNQSPALIAAVIEQAQGALAQMPGLELLRARRTVRVAAIAAAALLALASAAALHPEAFAAFVQRVLGAAVAYPRATRLYIELPPNSEELRVERQDQSARVIVPAGADLPILVRAEGSVPREVRLLIRGGRGMPGSVAMSSRGPARFRHMFRRVAEEFSFHAAGGDDPLGDLEVTVATIRPPRVASIRAALTPPKYAGLAPSIQAGGAIEALEGTQVRLMVAPTDTVQSARLTFLESGKELELAAEELAGAAGTIRTWSGSFTVERSDRYQVRLTSESGLLNPHPGAYPVVAVADHAPGGRILTPADDALAVVLPAGMVAVRLEARDDFGLAAVRGTVQVSKAQADGAVDLLPAPAGDAPPRKLAVATWLLDAARLPGPVAAVSVGDTISIGAVLEDGRVPEPLTTKLPARQVHVVAPADLARRLASHFRRIRDEVEELRVLQRKLADRLAEPPAAHADEAERRVALTAAQVGQARVQSRAAHTHEDLMRAYDLHLHNRLDESPHAARVLELWLAWQRDHPEPTGFLPGFYAQLGVERSEGRLGACPKVLDPILDMILASGRIASEYGPAAVKLLSRAAVDPAAPSAQQVLADALALQQRILAELDALAERLEAWNEFQDVILQTRSVLDKQREVQVRTRDSLRPEASPPKAGDDRK